MNRPTFHIQLKHVMILLAVICILVSFMAGFKEFTSVMCFGGVVSFVLMVFANLDKFAEFKAGMSGIEAKTREIEKMVSEGKDIFEELHLLAKTIGTATLSLMTWSRRMSGLPAGQAASLIDQTLSVFAKLGIKDKDVEATVCQWRKFMEEDHASYLWTAQGLARNMEFPAKYEQEMKELEIRCSGNHPPEPNELENFFTKCGLLTPNVKEWIEDYRHLKTKGTLRRPKIWMKEGGLLSDSEFFSKIVQE
ncbi:MAG: hypothetical protein ABSG35_15185 [Syntrophobacteraceae bacterium]